MNPLKDERGEVYGFVKVLRDDTKRRELEERLRILSYVAEQSSDFIGIATPEGKSIFLNKAGQKLIGSEKLPSDIMEHFLEEDKKFVKDVILPTQDKEAIGKENSDSSIFKQERPFLYYIISLSLVTKMAKKSE